MSSDDTQQPNGHWVDDGYGCVEWEYFLPFTDNL